MPRPQKSPRRQHADGAWNALLHAALALTALIWCGKAVPAVAQSSLEADRPFAPLVSELSLFQPLLGYWDAGGPGFHTQLSFRAGPTGRVVYAENVLRDEDGGSITRYEGLYYWSPEANSIEFTTWSTTGEVHTGQVHAGQVNTGQVNADGGAWHVARVRGGAIAGYRSVIQLTGSGTMEYRAHFAADGSTSDVLAAEPLVYRRRAQEGAQDSSPTPVTQGARASLLELAPLVGVWRSEIDPKYADHPAIRRFNPELKGQELTLEWGNLEETIHLRITDLDTPSDGERRPLIEGLIFRNPETKEIEFASYNAIHDQYYKGSIQIDPTGSIRRDYVTHFANGPAVEFRELWTWDDADKTQFLWATGQVKDGTLEMSDIEVRWVRIP